MVWNDGRILRQQEATMTEPFSPELVSMARELAARIQARSAGTILDVARWLVATTDDNFFGDREFQLCDQAMGIVADAYTVHLPKTGYTASAIDCPLLPRFRPLPRLPRKNGRGARRGGRMQPSLLLLRRLRPRLLPM